MTKLENSHNEFPQVVAAGIGVVFAVASLAFYFEGFEPMTGDDGSVYQVTAFVFSEVKWAAIGIVGIIWATLILLDNRMCRSSVSLSWVDLGAIGLSVYASLSLTWTPDRSAGLLNISHIAVAFSVYALARLMRPDAAKILLQWASIIGLSGIAVLSVFGRAALESGFGNPNFAAEAAIVLTAMAIPFWFADDVRVRWLVRALIVFVASYLALGVNANLQYLGAGAGLLYLVAALRRKRLLAILASASIVGATTFFVWLSVSTTIGGLPVNVKDRLQIWSSSVSMAVAQPIVGRGVGSYFHDVDEHASAFVKILPRLGAPAFDPFFRQAGASDNDLLDVWVEFGLIGLLLAGLLLVSAFASTLSAGRKEFRCWIGLVFAVGIGTSSVSSTFQNPATLSLLSLAAGVVGGSLVTASRATFQFRAVRVATLFVIMILSGGLFVLIPDLVSSAHISHASAVEKFDRQAAARAVIRGIEVSDRNPRSRVRLYTQIMTAGPSFLSSEGIRSQDLDHFYLRSASGSPSNPVLLDLRLKQVLSESGRELDLDEIEGMLARFKNGVGRFSANPHVLEAALAIQLGDHDRADSALRLARSLASSGGANNQTNLQNIDRLERELRRRKR